MSHLLLVTNCFPYSGYTEGAFIQPELDALCNAFDSVTIIPDHVEQEHLNKPNTKVYNTDYQYINTNTGGGDSGIFPLLKYLFHPLVIKAILKDRRAISSRLKLYSLLSFYHNAYTFKQWLKQKYFKPGHQEYVIYTFWFHANTLGAAMLAENENIRIVTRAHRYDIFDEEVIYRSHYLREFTLSKINSVYVCSNDGATYIRQHYPQYADKIKVSFLGSIKLNGGLSFPNHNINKLTFFSCSRIHTVKRVPLVAQFLLHLAYRFPKIEFEWIHAGDGEERDKVVEVINNRKTANFTVKLLGVLSNEEVQKLYLKEPIDWFISLSSSEGLPISICEALSYGVPVIATDVGGVHEVVSLGVGILLKEPTEMESFIIKISEFINDRSAYLKLRRNAVARWQELFDARHLRNDFVKEIS